MRYLFLCGSLLALSACPDSDGRVPVLFDVVADAVTDSQPGEVQGDVAPDTAPDVPAPDAVPDSAPDAPAPDAVPDSAPDAPAPDAVPDSAPDAPAPDATPDTVPDVPAPDAIPDSAPDAPAPDAIPDSAPDAPAPDAIPDVPAPDGVLDVPGPEIVADTVADAPGPDAVPDSSPDGIADAEVDTAPACDPVCAAGETCTPFGTCVTTVVPTSCADAHGIAGCCGPDDSVYWFENGVLEGGPGGCGGNVCGWNTAGGFYSCGTGAAAPDVDEDPSGTFPWECGPLTPVPADCPAPDCTDKVCGDDGSGGSCGDCPSGQFCDPTGACQLDGTLVCETSGATCTSATECECLGCVTDGVCTIEDDCVCPECAADAFCGDPLNCNNDAICDPFNEGCACADCAGHPSCP